jgi:alkylated DNA repair dioxygenase AlkB
MVLVNEVDGLPESEPPILAPGGPAASKGSCPTIGGDFYVRYHRMLGAMLARHGETPSTSASGGCSQRLLVRARLESVEMSKPPEVIWQPSLLTAGEPVGVDHSFERLERIQLDHESWVDHASGWVSGADSLFEEVLTGRRWGQRSRHMYEGRVREPRLTRSWSEHTGEPLEPRVLEEIRRLLGERYERIFDSVGFNLYRDGRDSVAWHGDRIRKEIDDPIVALVSLGEPRRFLLRPRGGSKSRAFRLGRGDLLVTGGRTQRTWEHSVPKVAEAGPRISLAYRHDLDAAAYAQKKLESG